MGATSSLPLSSAFGAKTSADRPRGARRDGHVHDDHDDHDGRLARAGKSAGKFSRDEDGEKGKDRF